MTNRFTAAIIVALCLSMHGAHASLDSFDLYNLFLQQEGEHEWDGFEWCGFKWDRVFESLKTRFQKLTPPPTKEELVKSHRNTCLDWLDRRIQQETVGEVIDYDAVKKLRRHPDIVFAVERCRQNYDCQWSKLFQNPSFWKALETVGNKWDKEKTKEVRLWQDFAQKNRNRGKEKREIVGNLAVQDLKKDGK